MRSTFILALLCGCLWVAPAVADPLTKRNNDATLRKPHLPGRPVHRPARPNLAPIRQDFGPTR